jgi:hypothetical protein
MAILEPADPRRKRKPPRSAGFPGLTGNAEKLPSG